MIEQLLTLLSLGASCPCFFYIFGWGNTFSTCLFSYHGPGLLGGLLDSLYRQLWNYGLWCLFLLKSLKITLFLSYVLQQACKWVLQIPRSKLSDFWTVRLCLHMVHSAALISVLSFESLIVVGTLRFIKTKDYVGWEHRYSTVPAGVCF